VRSAVPPPLAGEVATPDLLRGSRRGQRRLFVHAEHRVFQFFCACGVRPLHHASHGPPPPRSVSFVRQDRESARVVWALMLLLFLNGCSDPSQDRFQGYVEGEFVYVASPLAGQLEALSVQRGQQVTTGQPLFALDEIAERAALDQARAALILSEAEFARQEKLLRMGPAAQQDYDRARSARDQDRQRLAQAEWNFNQKKQAAPQSGLVYDTLFRQGEWVPAGKPVVVLLPPPNIKVRAFVPETRVGSIHYDDPVHV